MLSIISVTPPGSVWIDHCAHRYGGMVENSNCIAVCSASCRSGSDVMRSLTNWAIVFIGCSCNDFERAVREYLWGRGPYSSPAPDDRSARRNRELMPGQQPLGVRPARSYPSSLAA